MFFSDLKKILNGSTNLTEDNEVTNFSIDSRTLSGAPTDVFIALKGIKNDGHDFIGAAIQKGVKNFIVEHPTEFPEVNSLCVNDSLSAFQKIASEHRKRFSYPVVGITGSNGKTIVKEWLSTLLSERHDVIKSPKSYNSQTGVPISVLGMTSNHEMAIFEAGISKKGEMDILESIIQPTLGVFTTLGEAHDDGFSSSSEKLHEKLSLFRNVEKLICQSDQPWYDQLVSTLGRDRLITWSLKGPADHRVHWERGVVNIDDVSYQVILSDPASLQNITHCIVMSQFLGFSTTEIQRGLDSVTGVPMRLELKKGINNCYLLDDTYNNDLEGLKIAMDYLDGQKQNQSKTLILSDITHSSKSHEKLYKEIATLVEQKNFNRFIGVGPNLSSCKKEFKNGSVFFETVDEVMREDLAFEKEMILIKGARDFQLERLVHKLEERSHGTILEVNFEALQHNLNAYRKVMKPTTKIMTMVKANAYGSGLLEVSNFLQHQQVDYLGVAYVDEAIQLRKNGIGIPIMIMNPHIESFARFEQFNLEPEIYSLSHLRKFLEDSENPTPIHLKVDTGMHRLGFAKEEIPELLAVLVDVQVRVASVFTHFSSSDDAIHDAFTGEQAKSFDEIYAQVEHRLGYAPVKHACNSAAIVRWPQYQYDMVRLGIGLHGYDPTGQLSLLPASQLKSAVSQIQLLKKGETIGYSRKGVLTRDSKVAVIPIGYEDGFLRAFGNGNFHVRIKNQLFPTVGNVCMDMCMIDVTDGNVSMGDEVFIYGDHDSMERAAKAARTISHEILTNVSSRVKRVFVSE